MFFVFCNALNSNILQFVICLIYFLKIIKKSFTERADGPVEKFSELSGEGILYE